MVVWSVEQVLAVAPARVGAARPIAVPALWDATGCDDRTVWGRFRGGSGEPYHTMVDHAPGEAYRDIGARCTCPSRVVPCKHAVALLLVWAGGHIAPAPRPPAVEAWIRQRDAAAPQRSPQPVPDASTPGSRAASQPADRAEPGTPRPPSDKRSDERLHRVTIGLRELERWIDDRVRVGLADPSIARYTTWDELATRLVDAQASGLANRVRRLAGHVGARPGWHEHVLGELGVLHLLARAGQRLRDLEDPWADGVSAAIGFTVKQADVRDGVPETRRWAVMGRSDVVEDRIVVRRLWLRDTTSLEPHTATGPVGRTHGWAVLLSFAAYGQSLDSSLAVGQVVHADLHRFPGTVPLRALLGQVHEEPSTGSDLAGVASPTVAAAVDSVGAMLAVEPWLERVPLAVTAAPTLHEGVWALADHTGGIPLADPAAGGSTELATLLAASRGQPVTVAGEWTALGLVALSVHLPDRVFDIGPRGSFR